MYSNGHTNVTSEKLESEIKFKMNACLLILVDNSQGNKTFGVIWKYLSQFKNLGLKFLGQNTILCFEYFIFKVNLFD